jgi:hypothetical protein
LRPYFPGGELNALATAGLCCVVGVVEGGFLVVFVFVGVFLVVGFFGGVGFCFDN